MSSVVFPSSSNVDVTGPIQGQEQEQNFHHHDKRHTHKHRSYGKGGGRWHRRSVPGYVGSDYFPVKAKIFGIGESGHDQNGKIRPLSSKEQHRDTQAKELLDNLRWVKGTLASMGAGQKVIKQFGNVQHIIHVWAPKDQVVSNGPVVTHGENTKVTADVNLVGDAVANSLMSFINPFLVFEASSQELERSFDLPSENNGEAGVIVSGYTDVVGDVAAQRKNGSCSLKSDWKLDESNIVAKVFKTFATELDRKAVWEDKFSWQQAGRIWTEAMKNVQGNASIFNFKWCTLEAARKLYPLNKELGFTLQEAWRRVEAEMKKQLVLDGKNVTEICFKSSGGFTGLTETTTVPVQKLSADALIWLEKYFTSPAIEVVPDKGTTPATTVTYVFADGSQVTKYYDLQNLPQSLQDAISDPVCRKIGTQE